jgi:NAD-dependent SIR2 family protein deacetylase
MKLSPTTWCNIQGMLANLKCPSCFSAKIKLNEDEKENAKCEDCGCRLEFNPDIDMATRTE